MLYFFRSITQLHILYAGFYISTIHQYFPYPERLKTAIYITFYISFLRFHIRKYFYTPCQMDIDFGFTVRTAPGLFDDCPGISLCLSIQKIAVAFGVVSTNSSCASSSPPSWALGEGWHEKRMHNKAKNGISNAFMV